MRWVGFEPTTFGLWGQWATRLLYPAIMKIICLLEVVVYQLQWLYHTNYILSTIFNKIMAKTGFEPVRACAHCPLKTACLPFHHFANGFRRIGRVLEYAPTCGSAPHHFYETWPYRNPWWGFKPHTMQPAVVLHQASPVRVRIPTTPVLTLLDTRVEGGRPPSIVRANERMARNIFWVLNLILQGVCKETGGNWTRPHG